MENTTLAYAAGLMDGEGTITMTKRGKSRPNEKRQPAVSITSTSPELLSWMVENFGGNVRKHKTYSTRHRRHGSWRLNGSKAIAFLAAIETYLRETEKTRRARLLVNRYALVTPRNGKYTPEMEEKLKGLETEFFSFSRSPALNMVDPRENRTPGPQRSQD